MGLHEEILDDLTKSPKPTDEPADPAKPGDTPPAPPAPPADPVPPVDPEKPGDTPPAPPADPVKPADTPPANPDVSFLDDPEVKAIIEAKKAGKSFFDFAREFTGPDVKSMTDDQVFALGLQTFEGLNGDDLEVELTQYENASPLAKKKLASDYRARFENQLSEKLKQFGDQNSKLAETQALIFQKLDSDLTGFSQQIVDQEMYGFKVTDDISKKTVERIKSGDFNFQKPDGTFDAEKMFKLALIEAHLKDIVKVNITKAKNAGRKEVIVVASNPSVNKTGDNAVIVQPPSVDDAVESYANKRAK